MGSEHVVLERQDERIVNSDNVFRVAAGPSSGVSAGDLPAFAKATAGRPEARYEVEAWCPFKPESAGWDGRTSRRTSLLVAAVKQEPPCFGGWNVGSPGRTRTYNTAVNSRVLYH